MHVSAPPASTGAAISADRLAPRVVTPTGQRPAASRSEYSQGSERSDGTPRGGLRRLDFQLNRQAAAVQQVQAFVARAQTGLARIKADLSEVVAERQAPGAELHGQVRQFAAHWSRRAEATAGSLDSGLRLVDAGQAQRQFSIRGLDEPFPQTADRELLLFTLHGRASTPVLLEPGLSPTGVAKRLDQALAPLGVRVTASAQGRLQFEAAETAWPALRESLLVKGEGRLFPTGQFNRVRSEAEPELVRPERWRIDDAPAARQTLRDVVLTSERLEAVSRQAGDALAGLAAAAPDADLESAEARRAELSAQAFRAQAENASFESLARVLPASLGLKRERVTALLSLATQR